MIPIRDTVPARNYPVVNNIIIGLNVVVYVVLLLQGAQTDRFVYIYGLVPARYSVSQTAAYFSLGRQLFSFISFMFLHGGFFHLLGNMWSLYIFGDNVEDRLGPFRYLFFYLCCGILSALSHLALNFYSNVPTIGASGAVAGVMGAYFILHPDAKILTLIPILFIPWFIEIPAFFFLGLWFVIQFINAAGSHGAVSGVAWWAHIGGFVFGILLLKLFSAAPDTGLTEKIKPAIIKRRSNRLQVIYPHGPGNDLHLYGTIHITSFEALTGADKLVNIPWGFHKRLIRITVPAGSKDGGRLRLKGMGKQTADGRQGDLFLTVAVRS